MTTLKQEIIDELQCLDHLDQFSDEEMKPRAERILKLIEKRIDSRITDLKIIVRTLQKLKSNPINPVARVDELEKIKEMLK